MSAMKSGWLVKRGSFIKSWKRRWFVLTAGKISYYEDRDLKSLKGDMDVSGAYIDYLGFRSTTKWARANCIEITTKARCLVVAADTEKEAKEWAAALLGRPQTPAAAPNATAPAAAAAQAAGAGASSPVGGFKPQPQQQPQRAATLQQYGTAPQPGGMAPVMGGPVLMSGAGNPYGSLPPMQQFVAPATYYGAGGVVAPQGMQAMPGMMAGGVPGMMPGVPPGGMYVSQSMGVPVGMGMGMGTGGVMLVPQPQPQQQQAAPAPVAPPKPDELLNAATAYLVNERKFAVRKAGAGALVFPYSAKVDGKDETWNCVVAVDDNSVRIYSTWNKQSANSQVPQSKRGIVADFIARANYGLIRGFWSMDFEDGQLVYVTSFRYLKFKSAGSQGGVSSEFITVLAANLDSNFASFQRYLPGLDAVIFHGVSPKEAVDKCEGNQNQAGATPDAAAVLGALMAAAGGGANANANADGDRKANGNNGNANGNNNGGAAAAGAGADRKAAGNDRGGGGGGGGVSGSGAGLAAAGIAPDTKEHERDPDLLDLSALEMSDAKDALLGEGGSGKVFRASYCGSDVAVKVVAAGFLSAGAAASEAEKSFRDEIRLHMRLTHPRIVQMIGMGKRGQHVLLLTEYCANRSLHDVLRAQDADTKKRVKDWGARRQMAIEAAEGLAFLHHQKVVHLDLKPLNLLVTGDFHVKVADFGLSKAMKNTHSVNAGGFTLHYVAPEVILNQPFSFPADVYSFGIVLYQLFTFREPYGDKNVPAMALLAQVTMGTRPTLPDAGLHADARKLIESCWHKEPDQRPTMMQVLADLKKLPTADP